jgi:hypothetical protein
MEEEENCNFRTTQEGLNTNPLVDHEARLNDGALALKPWGTASTLHSSFSYMSTLPYPPMVATKL